MWVTLGGRTESMSQKVARKGTHVTYEERLQHRELLDRAGALRARLEGEDDAHLTRAEGRELVALLEEVVARLSPDRWDHMMETIAAEAARRAGAVAVMK